MRVHVVIVKESVKVNILTELSTYNVCTCIYMTCRMYNVHVYGRLGKFWSTLTSQSLKVSSGATTIMGLALSDVCYMYGPP